jgi:hypothetical protein
MVILFRRVIFNEREFAMTQDNDQNSPQESLEVTFNGTNFAEAAKNIIAIATTHTKEQPVVERILSALGHMADINPVSALKLILPVYRTLYKQDATLPSKDMVEQFSAIGDLAGAVSPLSTLFMTDEALSGLSKIAEQSPDQKRANSAMMYEGIEKIVKFAMPAATKTRAIVFEVKGEVTPKIPFILSLLEKVALAVPATHPLAQEAVDKFYDVVVAKGAEIDPFTATALVEMGDEIIKEFEPDSRLLPKVRDALGILRQQIYGQGRAGDALRP